MTSNEERNRLPAVERDILFLHEELRKPQTVIAKILGVSQPTVNYRYKRARSRLEFFDQLPSVTSEEVRHVLGVLGTRTNDIEAMVLYLETNSQSEVARRMNTSQGAARYWILRVVEDHLAKDMREDDMHKRVRTACKMLASRPGIFNEPSKPGHSPKHQKIERRLSAAPKFRGRLVAGEPIQILDGIYGDLTGTLADISNEEMVIELRLESREITLRWPRRRP